MVVGWLSSLATTDGMDGRTRMNCNRMVGIVLGFSYAEQRRRLGLGDLDLVGRSQGI